MDLLTSLIMGATYRKAAVLEQFRFEHRDCYPSAVNEYSDDGTFTKVVCHCGASIEATTVVTIVTKVHTKSRWQAA